MTDNNDELSRFWRTMRKWEPLFSVGAALATMFAAAFAIAGVIIAVNTLQLEYDTYRQASVTYRDDAANTAFREYVSLMATRRR